MLNPPAAALPDTVVPDAVATGDGSRTLHSARYGETFHSVHGARREAVEVYREAAGVGARLAAGERVRVLEIGFGLALNYLVTAERALGAARLDYHALEHEPQSAATIAALGHERHLECRAPLDALLAALERRERAAAGARATGATAAAVAPRPGRVGEDRAPELHVAHGAVALSLHVGDASALPLARAAFEAVYLDAFSPPVNPECWTPALLAALHAALRPGGTLVSYCVRGEVRRALEAAGFAVTRLPGPPGKRQTLLARRQDP